METETQKLGFFDRVIYSVQPSRYKDLIGLKGKKAISHLFLLAICLGIMQFVIPLTGWMMSFGGLDNFFMEVLPAIEMTDGKLSVENKIEYEDEGVLLVLIDTEKLSVHSDELEQDKYMSQILVAEENMIIYSSTVGAYELVFAELGLSGFNNESLLDFTPFIYFVFVISFFSQVAYQMFDILIWACLMALCCWGPFRIQGTDKLKYSRVVGLAIYAQTASKLVIGFNSCVNWISDSYILFYAGALLSMFLLMNGLRRMEEPVHE